MQTPVWKKAEDKEDKGHTRKKQRQNPGGRISSRVLRVSTSETQPFSVAREGVWKFQGPGDSVLQPLCWSACLLGPLFQH